MANGILQDLQVRPYADDETGRLTAHTQIREKIAMLLRRWRNQKGLNLESGARYLGLKSAGALSDIERGQAFPTPETIVTIYGATRGAVTALDHIAAWRAAEPRRFSDLLAAGRSASRAYRPAAKPKENRSGGKSNRRR